MIPFWSKLGRRLYSTTKAISPNGYHYQIVLPQPYQCVERRFDARILKPNYGRQQQQQHDLNADNVSNREATLKTDEDLLGIKDASRLASLILNEICSIVKVGMTTEDIDHHVYQLCCSKHCYPSPLHYCGFPKCLTTSVNNVVIHGIPDQRRLQNGDIITLDVTVFYNGYHGDCAKTVSVGNCDPDGLKLIQVSQLCLLEAIKFCKDGLPFNGIGETIEKTSRKHGFQVIPSVCGHGIGRAFHEEPQVLHYKCEEDTQIMRENMVFTIEPAITEGDVDVELLEDGWTVVTVDGSRTSQFEHTVCIKKDGAIVLTEG